MTTAREIGNADPRDGTAGAFSALALVAVAFANLAQAVDVHLMVGALPVLQGDLGLGPDEGRWLVLAALGPGLACIPLGPMLVKRYGRRTALLVGLGIFSVGSLIALISVDMGTLFASRVVTGIGCGLLAATAFWAFRVILPSHDVGEAVAVFVGTSLGAPLAFGPFVAALIVDNNATWRWIFVFELVVALIAIVLVLRNVLNDGRGSVKSAYAASLSWTAGALALTYACTWGERYEGLSDSRILVAVVMATVGCGTAIFLSCPRERRYVVIGGVGAALLLAIIAIAGTSDLISLIGSQAYGLTATLVTTTTIIRAFLAIALANVVGIGLDRVTSSSPRALVAGGLVIFCLADVMLASRVAPEGSFAILLIPVLISGVALGPILVPLLWIAASRVPRETYAPFAIAVAVTMSLGALAESTAVPHFLDARMALHTADLASAATLRDIVSKGFGNISVTMLSELVRAQAGLLALRDSAYALALVTAMIVIPLAVLPGRIRSPALLAPCQRNSQDPTLASFPVPTIDRHAVSDVTPESVS